jgi:dTDP-4-amino-4,6-dideoxygalactose transaminase
MCGTFGDLNILSFNGNKIITTSGGGALVSHSKEWIQKARFLATQARDPALHYEHSQIGYNYRMSNICAGIGRGQMEVLEKRVEQRRANFEYYTKAFSSVDEICFLEEKEGYFSNRWLTTILIKSNRISPTAIIKALTEENIEARPLWKPMHLQPVFSTAPFYGRSISDNLFEKGLCIPSGSNLSEKNLAFVADNIKKCIALPQIVV